MNGGLPQKQPCVAVNSSNPAARSPPDWLMTPGNTLVSTTGTIWASCGTSCSLAPLCSCTGSGCYVKEVLHPFGVCRGQIPDSNRFRGRTVQRCKNLQSEIFTLGAPGKCCTICFHFLPAVPFSEWSMCDTDECSFRLWGLAPQQEKHFNTSCKLTEEKFLSGRIWDKV